MKIKVIVEDVGANHATVEIEEACGMDRLESLLAGVNRELTRISTKKTVTPWKPYVDKPVKNYQSFEPASEDAKDALGKAARHNGTDLETVCREYGVDPKRISKRECWQMTHDLNERSGYGNA